MTMTLTDDRTNSLFTNPPAPGFTLWFRQSRGRKWEPVAHTVTESKAVDAIGIGNRHNGQWLILEAGREP